MQTLQRICYFSIKIASAQGGDVSRGKGVGGEVALLKLVKHPRRPSGCQGKHILTLYLWRNLILSRPTLATVGWWVQKQELSSRPALDSSILRAVPKTKLVSRWEFCKIHNSIAILNSLFVKSVNSEYCFANPPPPNWNMVHTFPKGFQFWCHSLLLVLQVNWEPFFNTCLWNKSILKSSDFLQEPFFYLANEWHKLHGEQAASMAEIAWVAKFEWKTNG